MSLYNIINFWYVYAEIWSYYYWSVKRNWKKKEIIRCSVILLLAYVWNHYLVADCPHGMEYQMCGLNIRCDDLGIVRDCRNSTCDSGCFCSNGTVLEDGVCVDPNTCPSKILLIQ